MRNTQTVWSRRVWLCMVERANEWAGKKQFLDAQMVDAGNDDDDDDDDDDDGVVTKSLVCHRAAKD